MASTAPIPTEAGPATAAISPESTQPDAPLHAGSKSAEISPETARQAGRRSDRALRELAGEQHGVLTLDQIEAAGLSPRAVCDRVASGRLRRVHAGIYAVDRLDARGRWIAAVLACGAGAVLSHRPAAALWGFGADGPRVDVSAPGRAGRSRTGIDVHRGALLGPDDVTVRDGVPCTTPARTLLDLAAVVDRRTLERAVDRAEELRVFDLDALRELLRRNPRRRGRRALAAILAEYDGPTATRSGGEEHMLALIVAAGLPRPQTNVWIALDGNTGYEADLLWPDARLIVEVDSRSHHSHRKAFLHDRQRDRKLALAGYETRRYAAAELQSRPERVIEELRQFLPHPGLIAASIPPRSAHAAGRSQAGSTTAK
jgi:predicted transcriptional regulator of viral defense system